MLNKNDIIEINIESLGYDGEGIAHIGGYTVFIKYALPGERVRAHIILAKPTYAVGKLIEVIIPSHDRTESKCQAFGKCGGCTLRHCKYEKQLEFKRASIIETFRKVAKIEVNPEKVIESPLKDGYRNKMSLPVRGKECNIGGFAPMSHRVVNVDNCPLQFEENGFFITSLREFMLNNGLSGYNETDNSGDVRFLNVRKIGGHFTVTLVITGKNEQKIRRYDEVLKKSGLNYSFWLNYNNTLTNKIMGDKTVFAGGEKRSVSINGIKVSIHPQSFFQINDGIRELLYNKVSELTEGELVIDAYSGAGLLSAITSKKAKRVIAVEIEPKATESAEELMRANDIHNVECLCGDCALILPELLNKNKADTVIADPPRSGCSRTVIEALTASKPKKIIYVSCNPATLARDCMYLAPRYNIEKVIPFDMFPHCADVETLCVLSLKNSDSAK